MPPAEAPQAKGAQDKAAQAKPASAGAPPVEAAHGKAAHGKAARGKAASAGVPPAKAVQAKAAGVFEALGEPVRRRMLELLADGERPVGPLVAALRSLTPISQPAVSQHLRVLLDAGLVRVRAAGTRRLYTLDTDGLNAARAWLDRLADPLAPFAQPLDALATEIARGRRADRTSADRTNADRVNADWANAGSANANRLNADTPNADSTPDRAGQDRRPA